MTPKQRMLNAYRGVPNDRPAVAPEFWYYYPAKVFGVDMLEFRKIPFHRALKVTFEKFGCEGWGITGCGIPKPDVKRHSEQHALSPDSFETHSCVETPFGTLTCASRQDRHEPGWTIERLMKDVDRDLPAFQYLTLGGDPENAQVDGAIAAWKEVGESYLLECSLGLPFTDWYGEGREGGFETAVQDLVEREDQLRGLQQQYIDYQVRLVRALCRRTPFESFFIGCAWSCNSLLGPRLWRLWDKPQLRAVCEEVHRHGRLLHVHIHGKCLETVADMAELGLDCVCPFERPPGGDVVGLEGLKTAARLLNGRTTMLGNIHTVETLIRGTPEDTRREVREVLEAFRGNPRVIIGTGDQVGRETPEENLRAMIDEGQNARV